MSTEFVAQNTSRLGADCHHLIVGFDGSSGSEEAVEWAAREAERRSAALRVVECWAVPADVDFYGAGARQQQRLESVVDDMRRRHRRLVIGSAATHLDPRDALITESETAELLVIGSSTVGASKQLLLGSVAKAAVRRSECPVVVVNGSGARAIERIVIGVDGSKAALNALDWACAEAELHGASLTIVHANEGSAFIAADQQVLAVALAECRARMTFLVTAEPAVGDAADALVRASQDADLVVIGSRGRSGFKTAVFGSVALAVAEHAHCPVAITHQRIRRD